MQVFTILLSVCVFNVYVNFIKSDALIDILSGEAPTTVSNSECTIKEVFRYNANAMPGYFQQDGKVIINLRLDLKQIISIDERNQLLQTSVELKLKCLFFIVRAHILEII